MDYVTFGSAQPRRKKSEPKLRRHPYNEEDKKLQPKWHHDITELKLRQGQPNTTNETTDAHPNTNSQLITGDYDSG